MANFPAGIRCSGMSYVPGVFPAAAHVSTNGNLVQVRASNKESGARLRIRFANITRTELASIRIHYQEEVTINSWLLSTVLLDGAEYATEISSMRWRYVKSPDVQDVTADVHNVSIELEHAPALVFKDTYTLIGNPARVAVGQSAIASLVPAISLVNVTADDFMPSAGLITFSEFDLETENPTYTFADYGGLDGQPTVNFSGFFLGQSLSDDPSVDCPGAEPESCVIGAPSNPLTLDPDSPSTIILVDNAHLTTPVLAGGFDYWGPISILFDRGLAGVGFNLGFFDAVGETSVEIYDQSGALLKRFLNSKGDGIEFIGFATSDGSEIIRGVKISIIGDEPGGFSLDSLRFAFTDQVTIPAS